ncbi:MAG: hypothetical protein K2L86_16125 [Lachnospiraceae bacterium]|nr:hypothetical protein [Lachnospiraceae bacterium]
MQIQCNQAHPVNHFNSRLVSNINKSNKDTSLHSRRRMMETQEKAQESEAVRVTISGEAMALARQVKAMERIDQFVNAQKEKTEEGKESVVLTDEELYEELWAQVKMWGDKTADILHDYNHKETKEMAGERAAALTQMIKLEELQKSEISKMQRDAQKDMVTASMQQEAISRKNSELLMMIESFEEQDEDEDQTSENTKQPEEKENSSEQPEGSLMEGQIGAGAAKREMGMLYTMNMMDASSTYRISANDHSVKGIETERKNIYRADQAENFNIKEKIAAMSDFVANLVNDKIMKDLFDERIESAKDAGDEIKQKKLEAMKEYFLGLDNKNQLHDLTQEREFALQERITARDLRISHLGDNHFSIAAHQKKELQSFFDEDDIMRLRGQSSVLSRMEDTSERLQEKLDERDHIDEDTASDEEIRDNEEKDEVHDQEGQEGTPEENL